MKITQKLLEKTTSNINISNDNLRWVVELGYAIEECGNLPRYKDAMRLPVIAGGAIRDIFFGLVPKDYDVFFDVSHIKDPDEKEDFVLNYLGDLVEIAKGRPHIGNDLVGADIESLSDVYRPGDDINSFLVYQTGWTFSENWPEVPMIIQGIGRNDPLLSQDNPVDFLKTFDYDAVKVLYDPLDKEFKCLPEFEKFLETLTVETDNKVTLDRIYNWTGRMYPAGKIKVIDNTPKQKKMYHSIKYDWVKTAGDQYKLQPVPAPDWPAAQAVQNHLNQIRNDLDFL